jgi:hypothetical protein
VLGISLPKLALVSGLLDIRDSDALTTVVMPKLLRVDHRDVSVTHGVHRRAHRERGRLRPIVMAMSRVRASTA